MSVSDPCVYGTAGCRNIDCTRDYCRRAHISISNNAKYTDRPDRSPAGHDAVGLPLDQEDT